MIRSVSFFFSLHDTFPNRVCSFSRFLLPPFRQSLPSAIAETHFSLTRLINVRRSRYRVSRFATDTNFFTDDHDCPLSLSLFFHLSLSLLLSGNYTRTRTNSLKWRKNSRVSLQAIIRLPLSLLSRITFYPVQSSGTQ